MKQRYLLQAKQIAREAGYHDIRRHRERWEGYTILESIFTDNYIHMIGFPQFLLYKEENIRWANPEEAESIFTKVSHP